MNKVKVAFCVAANKWQVSGWWSALTRAVVEAERDLGIEFVDVIIQQSASPDYNKNNAVKAGLGETRLSLTDANRNDVVHQVAQTDADYLYWWDDDTVHPSGTLRKLLDLQVPFAAGVYHIKNPPYPPIAYFKNPNGTYRAMLEFRFGELVEVDFTGMGCALIHRSVYEAIEQAHTVYKTDRGSYVVVEKTRITQGMDNFPAAHDVVIDQGAGTIHRIEKLYPVPVEEMSASGLYWPYYGMEVTRTEDIWFCQLAEHVGVKPLIDTSITCNHLGERGINRGHFLAYEFHPKEAEAEDVEAKN
jgi:hypothetical protein